MRDAHWNPREPIWHIIFKVEVDGKLLDYCREEPPLVSDLDCEEMIRFPNEEESREWATRMVEIHKLHSFVMEKW